MIWEFITFSIAIVKDQGFVFHLGKVLKFAFLWYDRNIFVNRHARHATLAYHQLICFPCWRRKQTASSPSLRWFFENDSNDFHVSHPSQRISSLLPIVQSLHLSHSPLAWVVDLILPFLSCDSKSSTCLLEKCCNALSR